MKCWRAAKRSRKVPQVPRRLRDLNPRSRIFQTRSRSHKPLRQNALRDVAGRCGTFSGVRPTRGPIFCNTSHVYRGVGKRSRKVPRVPQAIAITHFFLRDLGFKGPARSRKVPQAAEEQYLPGF
jgi:hypothetical protein